MLSNLSYVFSLKYKFSKPSEKNVDWGCFGVLAYVFKAFNPGLGNRIDLEDSGQLIYLYL